MQHPTPTPAKRIQTKELAERFGYQAATIRRHLCTKGHFFGLKPIKLEKNGRNLWPDVYPEQLTERS
jgi:hypothetical protein